MEKIIEFQRYSADEAISLGKYGIYFKGLNIERLYLIPWMCAGRNTDCDVFKDGYFGTPCTVYVISDDDSSSNTSSSRSNFDSSSGGSSSNGNSKKIKNSTDKIKLECVESDFNVDRKIKDNTI